MKCLIVVATVLQLAFGGHVNVQMPYLNPAGITYVTGHAPHVATPFTAHITAPAASAYTTSTYHGNGHFLGRFAHQLSAPVAAAAVVPTFQHVPAVADVPVTRIQAQPGYIHKELDVAKPAVKTNKYELRRPAIQKEFYDIEERVIVRPAGSALVELDQPHSKVHKSSVVSPLVPAHFAPAHIAPAVIPVSPAPPAFVPAPPSFGESTPFPVNDQGATSDDDSVVVEARRRPQEIQTRTRNEQQLPVQRTSLPFPLPPASIAQPQPQAQSQSQSQQRSQHQPQLQPQSHYQFQPQPQPVVRSQAEARFQDHSINQQRLIDLLTAREGIADVGFNGPALRNIGDAGTVRARVLSAEYAPRDAPVTGERVNTRRVVVSRPIETVEEVDVLEPVTKFERVAVQHPAVFKTAHVGYERVPTSLPVLGKAVAPIVSRAPLFTHSPIYYH